MALSRAQFLKSVGASILCLGAPSGLVSTALAAGKSSSSTSAANGFSSGNPLRRQIALTFDDGPTPMVTTQILAELKKRKLLATFFVLGQRVVAEPDLCRQIAAAGHEIGNHGYSNTDFIMLPPANIAGELEATQSVISQATGFLPTWFRPPGYVLTPDQQSLATNGGLRTALWSVDSQDDQVTDGKVITQTILRGTSNGSIILCHDLYPEMAGAIGGVLDGLLAAGYKFVTLSTLFANA